MRYFVLSLAVLLLITLTPIPIPGDCGDTFQGYTFITPHVVHLDRRLAKYFLDFEILSTISPEPSRIQVADNVTEWWERFCKIPVRNDVGALIYQAKIGDLQDLLEAISDGRVSIRHLKSSIANNSFAQYLHRHQCTETLDYLLFAKLCEPHVIPKKSWDNRPRDRTAMRDLIRIGQNEFMKMESHYFRLRYAYQIIRLAHYLQDYKLTLELYDFLMPKIDHDPSIIAYWIEGHRAGALKGLGKRVEASYIYSRIFEKCSSKREAAYNSFEIRTNAEWDTLNLRCNSDHERAILHILRANNENSRLLEEMRSIYGYEPENRQLEYLAIREVSRLEKDLLGLEFNDNRAYNKRNFNIPRDGAGERVIEMQDFVRELVKAGDTARPDFWKLLEGYLELLAGDYYFAWKTFKEVEKETDNDTLQHQLLVWQTVLQVLELGLPEKDAVIQPTDREELARRVKEAEQEAARIQESPIYLQYPDMADFMRDRFTELYKTGGSPGKAYISQYTLRDLRLNPQMEVIDDLLRIIRQPNRNRFEKGMVEKSDGTTIEPDLLDLKSSLLFAQKREAVAFETLKRMDRATWDNLTPGLQVPFVDRLNDCLDQRRCPPPDSLNRYNKGELFQLLLDMEYQARSEADKDQAARYYYLMGLAYYNISYFGPAWPILDEFRSGSSLKLHQQGSKDQVLPYGDFELGNYEFFDCSQARALFQQARIMADNRELAARATFMEAKCEQNEFFVFAPPGSIQQHTAFDFLIENYPDTKFFQEAIAECKYFEAYIDQ